MLSIQKKAIRILLQPNDEESVNSYLGSLKIVSVLSQYIIYETINLVKLNQKQFITIIITTLEIKVKL